MSIPDAEHDASAAGSGNALSSEQAALLDTFRALLRPLAQLAISKGVTYAAMDDLLRATLVEAARRQFGGSSGHGLVSRVSTATGLNRREVTRLVSQTPTAVSPKRWLAGEVFTKWLSDVVYKDPVDGKPMALPRQGAEPSFEALAFAITKDVHPRSLLEELCRLGMAAVDEATDRVVLVKDAMVPKNDFTKMVAFVAGNVGDHLQGSVANVLGDGNVHFDQAIVADELSTASIHEARALIQRQWQTMFDALIPELSALIERDQSSGAPQDRQIRIGLYSFDRPVGTDGTPLGS